MLRPILKFIPLEIFKKKLETSVNYDSIFRKDSATFLDSLCPQFMISKCYLQIYYLDVLLLHVPPSNLLSSFLFLSPSLNSTIICSYIDTWNKLTKIHKNWIIGNKCTLNCCYSILCLQKDGLIFCDTVIFHNNFIVTEEFWISTMHSEPSHWQKIHTELFAF